MRKPKIAWVGELLRCSCSAITASCWKKIGYGERLVDFPPGLVAPGAAGGFHRIARSIGIGCDLGSGRVTRASPERRGQPVLHRPVSRRDASPRAAAAVPTARAGLLLAPAAATPIRVCHRCAAGRP